MPRRRSSMVSLAVAALFAACGGDSPTGPGGDGGGGGGGAPSRVILSEPSFSTNINEIFARRGCVASGCHGDGAGGMTLGLDASANHDELVDVASATAAGFVRVVPGDAENSYLVMKLEGRQVNGARMPLGGSELDNIDITNIRNWIDNGAPEN